MPNPFDLDDHAIFLVRQLEKYISGDMHHRVEILVAAHEFVMDSRHQPETDITKYPTILEVLDYVRAYRPESFPDSAAQ